MRKDKLPKDFGELGTINVAVYQHATDEDYDVFVGLPGEKVMVVVLASDVPPNPTPEDVIRAGLRVLDEGWY